MEPVLITNWSQFVKEYGEFTTTSMLHYGVYGFFQEGGTTLYVVRAASDDAKTASAVFHPTLNWMRRSISTSLCIIRATLKRARRSLRM